MSTPSPLTAPTIESYIKKYISEKRQQYFIEIFKMNKIQPRHLYEMNLVPKSSLKSVLMSTLNPSDRAELDALVSDEGAMLSLPYRPYPTLEIAKDFDALWKKYSLNKTYLAAIKSTGFEFRTFMDLSPPPSLSSLLSTLPLELRADLDFAIWAEASLKNLKELISDEDFAKSEPGTNLIKDLTESLASVGLVNSVTPSSSHTSTESKVRIEKTSIPSSAISTSSTPAPAPAPKKEEKPALILSNPSAPPVPAPLHPKVESDSEAMPSAPGGPSILPTRYKAKA